MQDLPNIVTIVVTNVIIVLVVGVMVAIVTTDLMVTMVSDVAMDTFGTMVTKATKSYQCSLCGVIIYIHCMCFALQTFSFVLNPVVPSIFNGMVPACNSNDGILHLIFIGLWALPVIWYSEGNTAFWKMDLFPSSGTN